MTRQSPGPENQAAEHPVQLSLIDPYHRNRGLFSNHYLDERVSEDPFWQSLLSQAAALREAILAVWHETSSAQKENDSEGGLEDALIRPILKALGHAYSPQRTLEVVGSESRIPDYIFFPTEATKAKAESGSKSAFLHDAIAVGDAKAWRVSLDKKVGDGFSMQSPSYQIDYYIRRAGVPWGILTNGRFWRLYHRDTSYRLDTYYEIDLEQLIAQSADPDTEEKFLYFAAFFCKDAFLPDPNTGESFLGRALKGSAQYAKGIGDKLKGNVYEVLRLLCEGFLSLPSNRLTPADMAAIRENAFVVIYRLLFILYAEARGFLPVKNRAYAAGSLATLAHDITGKTPFEQNLSTQQTNYWDRLQNLFGVIDRGDESVGVRPYNGGLFSNEGEHSALTRWKISDRYVAQAIDLLARVQEQPGRPVFVDYRDLSVRELGTIYEGLLEQQPRCAEVDTAIVKQDKREIYVPADKLKDASNLPVIHQGSVYLATDKGERKTTGSYYTPDYIVKYIVSHALDPLLEEAKQASPEGGQKLADAILSIKVLDPAMGSGHFLVEATDYLARAYAEAMAVSDQQTGEEDIRLARRRVVERCVYGVDINPLAVELAKLSLWLYTVSENKPLNFLDHHLRCGNSLIGAEIQSLGLTKRPTKTSGPDAPGIDTALFTGVMQRSLASAVSSYVQIEAMPSDLLDQVKQKEQLFAAAREALLRYRQVCDIWTSISFGNAVPADGYDNVQMGTNLPGTAWGDFEAQPWFAQAMHIAQQHRFFHWELEFPEIFYNSDGTRKENTGFDAVVGNPPYDVVTGTGHEDESVYIKSAYADIISGRVNLYMPFVSRSATLLREGGCLRFIMPATFLSDAYLDALRRFVLGHFAISDILRIEQRKDVFEGVLQSTTVIGLTRQRAPSQDQVLVRWAERGEDVEQGHFHESVLPAVLVPLNLGRKAVIPTAPSTQAYGIIQRMLGVEVPLDEACGKTSKGRSQTGAITGSIQWDLYKKELSAAAGPRAFPLLWAEQVQRYFKQEPQARKDKAWITLPDGVPDATEPFVAVQRTTAVEQERRIIAAYIDQSSVPCFIENHVNYIVKEPESLCSLLFILAMLDSKLLDFFFRLINNNTQVSSGELNALPIRRISFTTPKEHRDNLVEQGKDLYEEYLASGDWSAFLAFIDQCLPQNPDGTPNTQDEQSDVVHDLLAFLAGEMTRLHEDKQAQAREFLDWLQRYVRVPIDQLAGKTTVENYWEPQAGRDALIAVLVKNRKAIQNAKGPDVTSAAVQAKIAHECDPSIEKLGALAREIRLTDRLIDQTVYRLYGLTPEEIAVVES